MREGGLARPGGWPSAGGIDGDVPETGAGGSDLGRKGIERAAMIGMPAAIFETAEVGIAHQANVAALGAFDDNNVIFIEVLALVYEFHVNLRNAFSGKSKR
ncbi:hypothetical protein D3C76_1547250 [compost metagenome]